MFYFVLLDDIIHPMQYTIAERGDILSSAVMQDISESEGIDNITAVVCTTLSAAKSMCERLLNGTA